MIDNPMKEISYEDFINNYESANYLDTSDKLIKEVTDIIEKVKLSKDDALISFSKEFDETEFISSEEFKFNKKDFKKSYESLDHNTINNLEFLRKRIVKFHSEKPVNSWKTEDSAFNEYGQIVRPIKRVGLYAPGGTATYPSSILMTAVLANIAGVEEIFLSFPPSNKEVTDLMLASCHIGGVTEAASIGGAQAIAAMAFGTESIKKVDKIFGPGNKYVAEAKRQVYGIVGIDSFTGPSEVMIIADESANPEFIAADLLAQAEHGIDSSCFLVLIKKGIKENINEALQRQLSSLARSEIAKKSLNDFSFAIEVNNLKEAEKVCNIVHPEHLQISVDNLDDITKENFSAGAIFIGSSNSAVFGDYCAGPSHVIPTNGASRFSSQVNLNDFFVTSSYSILSENHDTEELQKVIDSSIQIAELEGLSAHSEALKLRKENKKN
ncbi:histidinol dehydrogenase [SAR86 cluster bacterium]|nr:histidinol dehydrogenase [SAR86 cluster bacterium]